MTRDCADPVTPDLFSGLPQTVADLLVPFGDDPLPEADPPPPDDPPPPEPLGEALLAVPDAAPSMDAHLYGGDLFGDAYVPAKRGAIAAAFLFPPFSVLSARDGNWQERKRAWLALGIRSELGRGNDAAPGGGPLPLMMGATGTVARPNAAPGGSHMPAMDYSRGERGNGAGGAIAGSGLTFGVNENSPAVLAAWTKKPPPGPGLTFQARLEEYRVPDPTDEGQSSISGTSIFDPVICELCYTWFTRKGAAILDPFAGGSVRGIVAAVLGRAYTGIELSARQVAANQEQAIAICNSGDCQPQWINGNSRELRELTNGAAFDFVFSCPPYGDLEVYSDDPADLSTMAHASFLAAYREIIAAAVGALRQDRFAAFMVGDYRDPATGFYRNFVSETIAAFEAAGARLYNEAIYVTAVGSLPVRIGGQWNGSRKLGKTHQNLLVFCKGDPRAATAWAAGGGV